MASRSSSEPTTYNELPDSEAGTSNSVDVVMRMMQILALSGKVAWNDVFFPFLFFLQRTCCVPACFHRQPVSGVSMTDGAEDLGIST